MIKIATVFGTRPEILKLSSLMPLLDKSFDHVMVHTNQHYSYNLDKVFFDQLKLRKPNFNLNVGSGTHAEQASKVMERLEKILLEQEPDVVIVNGDTNSTMAAGITAAKLKIPLVHSEAGPRAFNKRIAEEINRIIVDHCSDILLAPHTVAYDNLLNEGIPKENICLVGDPIVSCALRARKMGQNSSIMKQLDIKRHEYVLVTVHHAEITNDIKILKEVIEAINDISKIIKIVFPMHPRTGKFLKSNNITLNKSIKVIEPQGYLEFINLLDNSLFVMSDSGGIQSESVALNVPCLILRPLTEWILYIKAGKNMLIGDNHDSIVSKVKDLLSDDYNIKKMRSTKFHMIKDSDERAINILKNRFK
ncbi:UDP-N-acetylglucosamine 2-epimerase (non-hydrolyzing) [Candidatus Woesearchaeota archaeon]|nr:UDP-N-acetylglucosamine 2-epimerase (non-hydrolyzing) [Candidatus Woesearchaeota archaeon]